MNVPHQDESVSLLAAKRVAAPASTWVRKAIAGTVLVAGCAVAAVAYAQAGASANTHAVLGAGAPHRLSPRQRAMRHYVASKRRYRVEGERSTLGQTTALAQQAAEFDSLTPDQQFAEVGDGGVDGSDFHHMNVYHVYPGIEGCETTCEGESVTKEQCDSMFFCEYDVGKCWSGVGRYPCPANEQELYDIWDDHYDDYETGMHHDLAAFPDYVYPGTYGCEATCEHVEMSQAQCDSMFYCEWDKDRCWSRVGPNDCPATEKAMHDLWYEYEYKNEKVDGIPATPTPSPVPVYTAVPTPLPQIHVHATPMPTPVVEASSWTNADGSTVSKNADGSTTTTGADGTVVSTDAAGVTTITATDGTTTVTGTDGTLTTSTTANAAPTATATPAWTPTYKPGDVSDASTIHEVTLDGGVTTTSLTPTATHTPTPLNVVTEANGVVVATNDGADVEAAQAEAEKAAAALPAGVQAQNLDLDGDDSTAPVVTETNVGVVVVDGSMVSTNDGVENSDTEHHHHLEVPALLPGHHGMRGDVRGPRVHAERVRRALLLRVGRRRVLQRGWLEPVSEHARGDGACGGWTTTPTRARRRPRTSRSGWRSRRSSSTTPPTTTPPSPAPGWGTRERTGAKTCARARRLTRRRAATCSSASGTRTSAGPASGRTTARTRRRSSTR
jgi:hypothetical protein